MSALSDEIARLRELGYSYRRISQELNCSKGTVSYYLSPGQKQKTRDNQSRRRAENALVKKVESFKYPPKRLEASVRRKLDEECQLPVSLRQKKKVLSFQLDESGHCEKTFTFRDVEVLFLEKPECYLTGRSLDIDSPSSYNLDHVVPRSLGGSNDLDNLGIASKQANQAKGNLPLEEFIDLCKDVVQNFGYTVSQQDMRK